MCDPVSAAMGFSMAAASLISTGIQSTVAGNARAAAVKQAEEEKNRQSALFQTQKSEELKQQEKLNAASLAAEQAQQNQVSARTKRQRLLAAVPNTPDRQTLLGGGAAYGAGKTLLGA